MAVATLERGEPGESHVVATDTSASGALIDQLVDAIDAVRGPEARAVGIGVPSVVEFATGRVRFSVNIPLAQPEALASISFILPADEAPGDIFNSIAQYAPALKQLAINCDWLGTSVDLESRRWMVATRRGQVACEMPERVTSWQNYMVRSLA